MRGESFFILISVRPGNSGALFFLFPFFGISKSIPVAFYKNIILETVSSENLIVYLDFCQQLWVLPIRVLHHMPFFPQLLCFCIFLSDKITSFISRHNFSMKWALNKSKMMLVIGTDCGEFHCKNHAHLDSVFSWTKRAVLQRCSARPLDRLETAGDFNRTALDLGHLDLLRIFHGRTYPNLAVGPVAAFFNIEFIFSSRFSQLKKLPNNHWR